MPDPTFVSVSFPDRGEETAYRDGAFRGAYLESTRVGDVFELRRTGGWPSTPTVYIGPSGGSASFIIPPRPPEPPPEPAPTSSGPLRTFRATILQIVPRWLRGKVGGSLLHAVGEQLDALTDTVRDGALARFPGRSADALPQIGRDRRIRRGLLEAAEHYAARLRPWLDRHRYRGGPYALLEQVFEYYAPGNFAVELRYASGRRFLMDADGVVTRDTVAWTPPGNPAKWARWWLTYQWPTAIDDDGTWGDPGTWGDGGVWGCSLSPAEVRSIRLIPREWGAAHAFGFVTLVSPGITITIGVETS